MNTSSFKRTDRIAELIQRKLSVLIKEVIHDPRLPSFVTIAGVDISKDLSYAKVFFTVLNNAEKETTAVLNASSKVLRTALAKSLDLRRVPALHFIYDQSLVEGQALSQLISQLNDSIEDEDQSP